MEELPSTSPANAAYSLEKLTEIWSRAIVEV
jgi:G:T/U-mismatch repair DNA glycosylase